jgi:hypothetical protein
MRKGNNSYLTEKSLQRDYFDVLQAEEDVEQMFKEQNTEITEEHKVQTAPPSISVDDIDFSLFEKQTEQFLADTENNEIPRKRLSIFVALQNLGESVQERNVARYMIDVDALVNYNNISFDDEEREIGNMISRFIETE